MYFVPFSLSCSCNIAASAATRLLEILPKLGYATKRTETDEIDAVCVQALLVTSDHLRVHQLTTRGDRLIPWGSFRVFRGRFAIVTYLAIGSSRFDPMFRSHVLQVYLSTSFINSNTIESRPLLLICLVRRLLKVELARTLTALPLTFRSIFRARAE